MRRERYNHKEGSMKIIILLFLCLAFVFCGKTNEPKQEGFTVRSPAFEYGQRIPAKFTCNGENISPEIVWSGVPKEAKCLALTFEDLSARPRVITHWLVYNIPLTLKGLPQNVPERAQLPDGARQAYNWESRTRYMGPCPGNENHQYIFRLYALDSRLEEEQPLNAGKVVLFIEEHALARADLVGYYR